MNIASYGIVFHLELSGRILSIAEATEILSIAFKKINLHSDNVGVSFEDDKLIPSENWMAQTYKKVEFTCAVINQGILIRKVGAKHAATRRAIAKLRQVATNGSFDTDYIRSCGTIKIEGIGARATNRGDGFTLTVASGDTQEAKAVVEKFTTIKNKDCRNKKATEVLVLTMYDEVADVMIALGLGDLFIEKAESIGANETWSRSLCEL